MTANQPKPRNDLSWGRAHWVKNELTSLAWRHQALPEAESMLPYGMGRSYGDSCLNDGGLLLNTKTLDRFIQFDPASGLIRCEAGVTLADILSLVVPCGWFLPVTPGTKFVTVGGAIANDVHGKNHHLTGTFGCHVTQFELLRSDGERLLCSPESNPEFFKATIAGLGLTGLISWAEIQLMRVPGPLMATKSVRYKNLDEFFELSHQAHESEEYIVGWVDCLAKGKHLGKGHFITGNHASQPIETTPIQPQQKKKTVPFSFPNFSLNRFSIKGFNWLYYWRQPKRIQYSMSHYDPFFYPLDAVHQWNRIYGKRGFYQYQFVVPSEDDGIIRAVMKEIAQAKTGSFLTVLKEFGDIESPGMLSYPAPGINFALDFPNNGQPTLDLLERLDRFVMEAGGKVYPAKDGRMSAQAFQTYYPQWEAFQQYVDPKFSSSFWRRVTQPTSGN